MIFLKSLEDKIWSLLGEVKDPEIPVISIVDLGMITELRIDDTKNVSITMAPTFSACPAIDILQQSIKKQIEDQLTTLQLTSVEVRISYDIQWNSNRITDKGKKILKEFGLAPPPVLEGDVDLALLENTACPWCDSTDTQMKTTFGSTLCRSIHYCNSCQQSFEQFKPVS